MVRQDGVLGNAGRRGGSRSDRTPSNSDDREKWRGAADAWSRIRVSGYRIGSGGERRLSAGSIMRAVPVHPGGRPAGGEASPEAACQEGSCQPSVMCRPRRQRERDRILEDRLSDTNPHALPLDRAVLTLTAKHRSSPCDVHPDDRTIFAATLKRRTLRLRHRRLLGIGPGGPSWRPESRSTPARTGG